MKKLLFTLAIILLFSTPAMALIRYVNPACTNGITTGIGTSACTGGTDTVHDTIQHAADVVTPGDTVIVKDVPLYSRSVVTGTINNPADTDTGYVIEMRIPLSTISPTIPVGGTTWGLLLYENNGSQQTYAQKSWPDGVAVGSYMNPSLWGSMIFEIANIPNLSLQ